ncbi:MAG: hypothetical protein QOI24_936 [Acidobacteriota bacterium]|nr:hypothetical protein [Acidobacteriota bacterium]
MLAFPLYLLSAVAALWIARRCIVAIPPRVCAVLILLPLVFTGRALLTGGVFGPIELAYDSEPLRSVAAQHGVAGAVNPMLTDVQRLMIPWKAAVRYAFAQHRWPLLNPFSFCGDILAAGSEPSPWHPFNALSYLLPLAQSITFHATLAFFAAALATYLFAKELGVGEIAALFAAVAWMFSAFLIFFIQVPLGAAVMMLPLVLLATRRVIAWPRFGTIVLLAATLALVVVAGHPESTLHVVAIGAAYGVFELAALRDRTSIVRAIGAAFAAGALALLLSAIHLLPFIDALPQTADYQFRVERSVTEARVVGWRETASRIVAAAVPFRFGSPVSETANVPSRYHRPIYGYAGSILFAPALIGLLRSRLRIRFFLLGVLIFGLLASVSAPLIDALFSHLPLFRIALNERLVFGAVLALAMLGALGIDAMLRDGADKMLWAMIAVAIVLVVIVAALWPTMIASGLSPSYLQTNLFHELLPLLLAIALLLPRPSPRAAALGLVALLLLQRTIEERRAIPTWPAEAFYPHTPLIDALPKAETPYRVAGREATFLPNIATHYQLEDARGATGMTFARMAETLPLWSRLEPVSFNHIDDLTRPFLSALNVRYAFEETRDPIPDGWRVRAEDRGARLLENPRALERAFIPRQVMFTDDVATLALITDFRDMATVSAPPSNSGTIVNGGGTLRTKWDRLDLRIDARLDSASWIVISQTAWRGWQATIDGRDAPLFFGNHAFLAAHVPAGHHELVLRYRPLSFFIGLGLTLATLAALLAIAAVRR